MLDNKGVATTVALMCIAHVLSMLSFSVYPAFLPELQVEWNATNTEMGWVAGIYFGGYVIAVGILVSITDRFNARHIYLLCMALGIVGAVGFAIATTGVQSASVWRCLQGIAVAGTYFPGLKALVDAVPDRVQSRTVAVYTACFGFGVAVSFLFAGALSSLFNWQWMFAVSALGPVTAFLIAYYVLPSVPPKRGEEKFSIIDNFRTALRNRKVLGYSIAYGTHNVELFVFRSWIVAYLVFVFGQHEISTDFDYLNPAVFVAIVSLISQPFSILTNEIAERTHRAGVVCAVIFTAAAVGILLGFASIMSIMLVLVLTLLYGILSIADSASITTTVVKEASSEVRGTTLASHSLIGFIGAFVGPIIFGATLDIAGGAQNWIAWGLAFVVTGAITMIGPLAIYKLARNTS